MLAEVLERSNRSCFRREAGSGVRPEHGEEKQPERSRRPAMRACNSSFLFVIEARVRASLCASSGSVGPRSRCSTPTPRGSSSETWNALGAAIRTSIEQISLDLCAGKFDLDICGDLTMSSRGSGSPGDSAGKPLERFCVNILGSQFFQPVIQLPDLDFLQCCLS